MENTEQDCMFKSNLIYNYIKFNKLNTNLKNRLSDGIIKAKSNYLLGLDSLKNESIVRAEDFTICLSVVTQVDRKFIRTVKSWTHCKATWPSKYYCSPHPVTTKYIFLSTKYRIFAMTGHVLGYKTHHNKLKRIKI